MFTIKQIDDLHARLGKAQTFFEYVLALHAIGVERYDSFVTDGHSEYFGNHGHNVVADPVHEKLFIAEKSDRENFLKHLALHEQGKTTYLEMSEGLAGSGIEKLSVDVIKKTMIYYDVQGNEMLVETLE